MILCFNSLYFIIKRKDMSHLVITDKMYGYTSIYLDVYQTIKREGVEL